MISGAPGPGTVVLRPGDHMLADAAAALKREVREALGAGRNVIVDLTGVTFLDSSGLGALVTALRSAKQEKRRLVLCSVPENVLALFRLTRLHRSFEIQPDLPTARIVLGSVR